MRCSHRCKQRALQSPPAISELSEADRTMASSAVTHASVNRVALDRSAAQPLGSFAEVLEMVTIQRDGVHPFDPAKIIKGAGVHVSDLLLDDALAELLNVIASTTQSADAVDMNMIGFMFATFTSAGCSTAVKTAAALAVSAN